MDTGTYWGYAEIAFFAFLYFFMIFGEGTLHGRFMKFLDKTNFIKPFLLPPTAIEAAGVEFQAFQIGESVNQPITHLLPPERRLPTKVEYSAFMDKFGFTRFRCIDRIDDKVVARNSGGWLLTVNTGSTSIYRQ